MDYKKIAKKRLDQINVLSYRLDRSQERLADDLTKELRALFHAHCIAISGYGDKIDGIAKNVAARVFNSKI